MGVEGGVVGFSGGSCHIFHILDGAGARPLEEYGSGVPHAEAVGGGGMFKKSESTCPPPLLLGGGRLLVP